MPWLMVRTLRAQKNIKKKSSPVRSTTLKADPESLEEKTSRYSITFHPAEWWKLFSDLLGSPTQLIGQDPHYRGAPIWAGQKTVVTESTPKVCVPTTPTCKLESLATYTAKTHMPKDTTNSSPNWRRKNFVEWFSNPLQAEIEGHEPHKLPSPSYCSHGMPHVP